MIDLNSIPKRRLAEMWCELNVFKMPPELIGHGLVINDDSKDVWHVMQMINEIVPQNQCLWVWREQRGLSFPTDGKIE